MFNDKERDMNPPEPKEEYEPDVDSINDEIWLRKKEEEETKHKDTDVQAGRGAVLRRAVAGAVVGSSSSSSSRPGVQGEETEGRQARTPPPVPIRRCCKSKLQRGSERSSQHRQAPQR